MLLTKCSNPIELIPFLELDYANNLYFFTYLSENITNPPIRFLTIKNHGEIELVLLITPIHCCISTVNINHISAIAGQLPSIDSIHVLGRRDFIEPLLNISKGPERDQHLYSLSEFTLKTIVSSQKIESQRASSANLNELIEFYNNNDKLFEAEGRLPGILTWGKAYFVRKENKIISCSLTTTETNDTAMIGSVYTIPEYRNEGYARDCMLNLCRDLLTSNKKPYLFYKSDNALLGSMYHSLGFRPINTWMLASRK